jgi:hypothetical protein
MWLLVLLLLLLLLLLQVLHHGSFMVLLHAAARVIFSCVDHVQRVTQLLEAVLGGINASARQVNELTWRVNPWMSSSRLPCVSTPG